MDWFQDPDGTLDGRNPTNQLIGRSHVVIAGFLNHQQWLLGLCVCRNTSPQQLTFFSVKRDLFFSKQIQYKFHQPSIFQGIYSFDFSSGLQ